MHPNLGNPLNGIYVIRLHTILFTARGHAFCIVSYVVRFFGFLVFFLHTQAQYSRGYILCVAEGTYVETVLVYEMME